MKISPTPIFSLLVFIAMMISIGFLGGCEQQLSPPPAIEVEQTDTESSTGVTIYYRYHYSDQSGPTYIELNSPEEIRAYKEKVEFLLSRLEEAELRMGVHEDVPIE
jgi:hypothetical protein